MAETGAVFGGEHSGHFYFGNFWCADSGMLAALFALSELGGSDLPLSQLLAPYDRYISSGEINTQVVDTHAALEEIKATYQGDYPVDDLDGYTITGPDWWFNVRGSNTEPLLRLNVEADSRETMERVRDQVLALIR
jgi:phosphomannomutase